MRPRRSRKLLTATVGLIVLAGAWFYLAPVGLGGSTTYVVTDGISMEPRFHTGDLATRAQPEQATTWVRSSPTTATSFTRPCCTGSSRATGYRYVFKGDNNNFVDFEHPAASQLIGALWLHIPRRGRAPAVAALAGAHRRPARASRRSCFTRGGVHPSSDGAGARSGAPARAPGGRPSSACGRARGPVGGVLAVGLLALLPFCVLALLAFTRAPTGGVPSPVPTLRAARSPTPPTPHRDPSTRTAAL